MNNDKSKAPFKGGGCQGRYEDDSEPTPDPRDRLIANVAVVICIVLVVGVLSAVRG